MTLSDLRISHNLTQDEISRRTGIPYNSYRRYEYGQTFPKPAAIIALAKLYSMRPGELFEMLIGMDSLCRPL